MTLDHIGIAIQPEHAALYERLLASRPYKSETVEREGVRTLFFGDNGVPHAAPKLELLDATRPDSPVARFLDTRGPGIHHLAFEVGDLEAEMERVRALGIRLLAEAPKAGADGKRIVFLHPKDTAGVLVELIQSVRPEPEWVEIPTSTGPLAIQVSGLEGAPPLLVLHGALGSTELETDRLIRFWERDFRVYGLDFEEHGRSRRERGTGNGERANATNGLDGGPGVETPRGASALGPPSRTRRSASRAVPTWQTYVDNTITAFEHFGLEAAAVFGFSLGGAVALALAAERPGMVDRLASHGANVQWTDLEVAAMIEPMDFDRLEGSFWGRRLEDVHGPGWRHLVEDVAAFTRGLPADWIEDGEIARIECPTLISHGDSDRFFDVRHPVNLYRHIPDASLWIVPGLDHPIQGLEVASFAARVGAFLAG